jgi:ketosteroid isomerase-like protein
MTAIDHRRLVERFWSAMAANDFRAAGALLHDDYVLEWPQSGERIRGRDNFVAVNEHYPAAGPWRITLRRIVADRDGVATEVEVTDGVRRDRAVTFSELRDGRIARQIEYWPDPTEPAAWRARWVERTDG